MNNAVFRYANRIQSKAMTRRVFIRSTGSTVLFTVLGLSTVVSIDSFAEDSPCKCNPWDIYDTVSPGSFNSEAIFSEATVCIPGFATIMQAVFGSDTLRIPSAHYGYGDPRVAAYNGTAELFGESEVHIFVEFSGTTRKPRFSIRAPRISSNRFQLSNINKRFLKGTIPIPKQLLEIQLRKFEASFKTRNSAKDWTAEIGCEFSDLIIKKGLVSILAPKLDLEAKNFIKRDFSLAGDFEGNIVLIGYEIKGKGSIAKPFTLSATLPKLSLSLMIPNLAGSKIRIPKWLTLPSIGPSNVEVKLLEKATIIEVCYPSARVGSLAAVTRIPQDEEAGEDFAFTALFHLPGRWKMSNFNKKLAAMNRLTIKDARIVFSTFQENHFKFPCIESGQRVQEIIEKGISLKGQLELKGEPFDFLKHLFGKTLTNLDLEMNISDDFDKLLVVARPDVPIIDLKVLAFKNFHLNINTDFEIKLMAMIDVNINGQKLPRLKLAGVLGEPPNILVKTEEPWKDPIGIKGLTVENFAIQFGLPSSGTGVQVGILGRIEVSGDMGFDVACSFLIPPTPPIPEVFSGCLEGEYGLTVILEPWISGLPLTQLNIMSVENPEVYIVLAPCRIKIAGEVFEPGFILAGLLNFFGISLKAGIRIKPEELIEAEATIDQPIQFLNILKLSNKKGDQGPLTKLYVSKTNGELILDAEVNLLGLVKGAKVVAGPKNLSFTLEEGIRINFAGITSDVSYIFACAFYDLEVFEVLKDSSVKFDVGVKLSTFSIFGVKGEMELIAHIDAGLHGKLSLEDESLKLDASVRVKATNPLPGRDLDMKLLDLTLSITYFDQIPREIAEEAIRKIQILVQDKVSELFNFFLESPEQFVYFVRDQAIVLTGAVTQLAGVLKTGFEQPPKWIGEKMKDVLKYEPNTIADGLNAIAEINEVCRVLLQIEIPPANAAKALEHVGQKADQIAEIYSTVLDKELIEQIGIKGIKEVTDANFRFLAAETTAMSLKDGLNIKRAESICKSLKKAKFSAPEAAYALEQAKFSKEDCARFWSNVYSGTGEGLNNALKEAGKSVSEGAKETVKKVRSWIRGDF